MGQLGDVLLRPAQETIQAISSYKIDIGNILSALSREHFLHGRLVGGTE